jgi:uncharacterized repeat protein (TIGR01451 family)
VGLAATALAAGMLGAPVLAYGDATGGATPEPTATSAKVAETPSVAPTTATASPRTTPAAPTPSATTVDPSPNPSPESTADSASPTPETTPTASAGRVAADARQAPAPAAQQSGADQVQAQAAAGAAISLTKSASPSRVSRVGQVVRYTFVTSNTGTVPLTDVTLTDGLEGLSEITCSGSTRLAPAERRTCTATLTITQDWLDFGDIDNSATVFGSFPIEESNQIDYVGANATAHVIVDQKPRIALVGAVSPAGTADAGDRLRYEATATNTGNVTLRGARITSSLSSLDLDCAPSARATLAPGESLSCSGRYRVSDASARRGRVVNELTARASGPYDDQRVSDDLTLRTEVTKISSADPGLADTGGPGNALPVGLLGVTAVAAGAWLIRRAARG